MSIRRQSKKGTGHETSYSITPVIRKEFTDWNGGLAVADRPENRRDGVLLERPTMEMGNETKIGYNEMKHSPPSESVVISKKNLYERFRAHNRDTWWEYRIDSTTSRSLDNEFKKYLIFAFCDEVSMNNLQKQHAFRQFMELDLRRGTGRTEENALIICSLIANEDAEVRESKRLYHPQRSPENNDKEFQRLENSLTSRFSKVTKSSLTKVHNKLSQGNPPLRNEAEWQGKVRRESEIPHRPSLATLRYDLEDKKQ